jgi:hypothetical protein
MYAKDLHNTSVTHSELWPQDHEDKVCHEQYVHPRPHTACSVIAHAKAMSSVGTRRCWPLLLVRLPACQELVYLPTYLLVAPAYLPSSPTCLPT